MEQITSRVPPNPSPALAIHATPHLGIRRQSNDEGAAPENDIDAPRCLILALALRPNTEMDLHGWTLMP
jgi:hypothetical protein